MRRTIEILANAFSYGETDLLEKYLHKNCKYSSDCAHKHVTSPEQILTYMKNVYANIQAAETDSSYSHQVVKLDTILKEGVSIDDLHEDGMGEVCEYGILLYQRVKTNPVAVVYIKTYPGGLISEIHLSRNPGFFDVDFYGTETIEDSTKDIPYTVKPMTQHDKLVSDLRNPFTGQRSTYQDLDDSEVYIWRQADGFFKEWLKSNGYTVAETAVFDDCIGYKCTKGEEIYTIYMLAFGQSEKQRVDGDSCAKYQDYEFSEGIVLVSHLMVKREVDENKIKYKVGFHSGADDAKIELWRPITLQGKNILLYYPGERLLELTEKLVLALDAKNFDLLEIITSDQEPVFDAYDSPGYSMNEGFFSNLYNTCNKYGKVKIGYVSFNKIIYSIAPYIDGYGWFAFSADQASKIHRVSSHKFTGDEKYPAIEFVKANVDMVNKIQVPQIVSVEPLKPVLTERFAVKVSFANGEVKKYVLPIDINQESEEVVPYKRHVFTDKIWNSVSIVEKRKARVSVWPECGQGIAFKNGFSISALKCYEEGIVHLEPILCDEILYEDENISLQKKWDWSAKSVVEDRKTGVLKVLLYGGYFNWGGISTIANAEGVRHTLEFRYLSDFKDGLALVSVAGRGCGYINPEGQFVIPPIYDEASGFCDGYAKVGKDGKKYILDSKGNVREIENASAESKYEDMGEFSEGLCKVSTLKLDFMDLAYHSDYSDIAGIWGFINEQGEVVVPPQYIYATDFYKGIALVAKGKWTRDEKWNNKYNKGRYWTDIELWGAIDTSGKEVIPCVFDDIKTFFDVRDVFIVHYGGWENGKWGVIDREGKWLADPMFEGIGYEYQDGLFTFYEAEYLDDGPAGIYDISQQKVLFEPQFSDVNFLDDGYIQVQVFDEKLGREVARIIDREGNEKFHSEYSSIYTVGPMYEVVLEQEGVRKRGFINADGSVVVPCEYEAEFSGFYPEQKLFVCRENDKKKLCDFDGKEIIPAKYDELYGVDRPLITVCIFKGEEKYYGLITHDGKEILPPIYKEISWCKNRGIICKGETGCMYLKCVEK